MDIETPGATAPLATPNPIPATAAPVAPAAVPPSPVPVQATPAAPVAAVPPASQPPSSPEAPLSPAPAAEVKPTSLLGAELPKTDTPAETDKAPDAPAEAVAQAEPPKEEVTQSAEAAPVPTFEAFTLPEGLALDNEKLGDFTKDLAEFETLTKADHAEMQKFGQKLVERHVAEIQSTVQRLQDHYMTAWEKQRNDWKTASENDPEIGGNRFDTSINAALQFIGTHGGSETQQQEFRALMDSTGVGNHPALIRILAKANAVLSEGRPLPGTKPPAAPQSKVSRRYGGTN